MSSCKYGLSVRRIPGQVDWQCPETGTVQVTTGCVHEHVRSDWYCEKHAARAAGENVVCGRCWRSADPHECPIVARVVEAEVVTP